MKSSSKLVFKTFLLIFFFTLSKSGEAQKREFFQLRIFHLADSMEIARLDDFLKNDYMPALHKAGISNIGVFKPKDEQKKIYVLMNYNNLNEIQIIEDLLFENKNYWNSPRMNTVYNAPLYSHFESIILRSFSQMPFLKPSEIKGNKKDRVYELRSYESASEKLYKNKVAMFNEGGEVALFKKLGFDAVFYGEVLAGSAMPNLMYMTTFENMESRDKYWESFRTAPEWLALKIKPEYKNNVKKNNTVFLYPTEYSDY